MQLKKPHNIRLSSVTVRLSVPFTFAAILTGLLAGGNLFFPDASQYRGLAESFLQGKLYFLSMPGGWGDTALFQGRYYWPLGILPAVFIMPLVRLGIYHQGLLSLIFVLGVFYLCFRLAQKLGYSRDNACWLALAFCYGTAFVAVAAVPLSWPYAQVVTVFFLFLAINEFVGRRRFGIVGFMIGLAAASRPLAVFNAVAFCGAIMVCPVNVKHKVTSLAAFAGSLSLIIALIAWYNYARFGDPLEFGYRYQLDFSGRLLADTITETNYGGPVFSFGNIPRNFFVLAFGLPGATSTATSVFLTSPFLVFLFISARRLKSLDYLLLISICLTALVMLAYRSSGGMRQIGYRYLLDCLPLVFWFLMRRRTELSGGFKKLISLAVIVDVGLLVYAGLMRFK